MTDPNEGWEWEGHTLMTRTTIQDMLKRNDTFLYWSDILRGGLAQRTEQRDDTGDVYYAVLGGIGKFMEDCIIFLAVRALEREPDDGLDLDQIARVREQWL